MIYISSPSFSALVVVLLAAARLSTASPISSALGAGSEGRLEVRGSTSCSKKSDCNSVSRPRNSFSTCSNGECGFACSTGFFWNANRSLCQVKSTTMATTRTAVTTAAVTTARYVPNPKAVGLQDATAAPEATTVTSTATATATVTTTVTTTTTTTTTTTAAASTGTSSDAFMIDAKLSSSGITGFNAQTLGWNTNAIMSWFRTNSAQDSTNGHSWCYNKYDDTLPGFAPDVSVMLKNFANSNILAGTAYCGLEAEFVLASGKTTKLILLDGFDTTWVKTPSSIDVIYDDFMSLYGSVTNNKNNVETSVKWRFTGRRDSRYIFNTYN